MLENTLWFMNYPLPYKLQKLFQYGEYEKVLEIIKKDNISKNYSYGIKKRIEYEIDKVYRWKNNYPYTLEDAYILLKKEIDNLSFEDFNILISRGCIDTKEIDNKTFVYKRFIPNLFWLCKDIESKKRKKENQSSYGIKKKLKERVDKILSHPEGYVLPIQYHIQFKIKILDNVIPSGERVKVWLPLPREDGLNTSTEILYSKPKIQKISNKEQRTVFFDINIDEYDEIILEYKFTSYGFYRKINEDNVVPNIENDEIYKKYTIEKPPHIVFTPFLVNLAEKIVRNEKNPYLRVKRIWKWITYNVRYTYAHDYALYDNISEYVARYRRGDCGMQALLFITLCRIVGIPARWQSGWYLNPKRASMHDWSQFYIEPYGWLYADPSFGSFRLGEEWRNTFYLGGIEGYRLAANIDISVPFDPPKKFFRSDPVDNQRGEIEWRKGNLYYDKWEQSIKLIKVYEQTN